MFKVFQNIIWEIKQCFVYGTKVSSILRYWSLLAFSNYRISSRNGCRNSCRPLQDPSNNNMRPVFTVFRKTELGVLEYWCFINVTLKD